MSAAPPSLTVADPPGRFEAFLRALAEEEQYQDLAAAVLAFVARRSREAKAPQGNWIAPAVTVSHWRIPRRGLALKGVEFAVVTVATDHSTNTRTLLDGRLCWTEGDARRAADLGLIVARDWLASRPHEAE